jgi:hypothetical protein
MVFSERQKLAEEIIFLSEKRGITDNDLHVLRWLRYRSAELQTYYKLKRKI